MNKNIKKTVFEIFSDVMDIPISELKLESTPDNIGGTPYRMSK